MLNHGTCLANVNQEGNILEILGNRKGAYERLLWGKKFATSRHLPIFEVRFSIALGMQFLYLYVLRPCFVVHPVILHTTHTFTCFVCILYD